MRIDSSHPGPAPYCLRSRHVIRLRGPWRWKRLTLPKRPGAASQAATRQVDDRHPATFRAPDGLSEVLATTPAGSAHFRVRLSRVFRCPTGLDARSSVELVIEPIVVPGIVRLNSIPLGPLQPGLNRYAIAQHLQDANELQLDLEFDPAVIGWQTTDGPRIDVRLEII